jgi:excisionase family DNA binding protein
VLTSPDELLGVFFDARLVGPASKRDDSSPMHVDGRSSEETGDDVMDSQSAPLKPVEPLWTAEDVAAYLRVSLSMVYKLRREGRLPSVAVGALYRFNAEDVRAFARGDFTRRPLKTW